MAQDKPNKPQGRDNRAQATVSTADAQQIASVLEGQGLAPELVAALRNGGWVKVLGPDDSEPEPAPL